MDKLKPILRVLLIVFILYAIFSSPAQSADVVRSIFGVLKNGVENLKSFYDHILGR